MDQSQKKKLFAGEDQGIPRKPFFIGNLPHQVTKFIRNWKNNREYNALLEEKGRELFLRDLELSVKLKTIDLKEYHRAERLERFLKKQKTLSI